MKKVLFFFLAIGLMTGVARADLLSWGDEIIFIDNVQPYLLPVHFTYGLGWWGGPDLVALDFYQSTSTPIVYQYTSGPGFEAITQTIANWPYGPPIQSSFGWQNAITGDYVTGRGNGVSYTGPYGGPPDFLGNVIDKIDLTVNRVNVDSPDFIIIYQVDFYGHPAAVPEPATMLLLGSGVVGLLGFRRKSKK